MITQNFFGPVEQVAGETIVNAVAERSDWLTAEQRELRRQELVERGRWHISQRDAAEESRDSNGFRRLTLGCVAALFGLAFYCLQTGLRSVPAMAPVFVVVIAVMAVSSHLLQLHRANCEAEWRTHNDAVREINRLLAGL